MIIDVFISYLFSKVAGLLSPIIITSCGKTMRLEQASISRDAAGIPIRSWGIPWHPVFAFPHTGLFPLSSLYTIYPRLLFDRSNHRQRRHV